MRENEGGVGGMRGNMRGEVRGVELGKYGEVRG